MQECKCPTHNGAIKSFVWSSMIYILKTDYFLGNLWFLYKSDLRISTSKKTYMISQNYTITYELSELGPLFLNDFPPKS